MAKRPDLLLSDVTNIIATGAHDGMGKSAIVTVDEMAGRVSIAIGNSRAVKQRFHVFIVEEPH